MNTRKKIDISERVPVVKKEPEGRIYPIRVSPTTVFYVTKEKNTPEYRQKLIDKYNSRT